jgi:Sortase domain
MDLGGLTRRALPALLIAASVVLLSAGVFNWAPPQSAGAVSQATPTADPGDPVFDVTPPPWATPSPVASGQPTPSWPTWTPPTDPFSPLPGTTPTPRPTSDPTRVPTETGDALPTRIVIPSLGIDLAVVGGDTSYPLCDVAQYLYGFANPGQPGTTYLYGHARAGMFLPLLTESEQNDGARMIGAIVKLYTADEKLHLYQINIVKRHATDLSLAFDLGPGQHRLIMQTSEGPHGTVPKLQVAARPIGVYEATAAEALPTPHPRDCGG